jgi:hypothetical protein
MVGAALTVLVAGIIAAVLYVPPIMLPYHIIGTALCVCSFLEISSWKGKGPYGYRERRKDWAWAKVYHERTGLGCRGAEYDDVLKARSSGR